jgi:DnaK suppressor protein
MKATKSNQTTMTIDTRESDSRQHTRRRQAVRPESNVRTRRTNRFAPFEIERFEAKLLAKRDEVLRTLSEIEYEMSGADTNGTGPMDLADRASLNHTIEEDSGLLGCERRVLEEIREALSRIQDGTYGRCQHCMKPIPKRRLQVIPWANYCVPCANEKPISKQETDEN